MSGKNGNAVIPPEQVGGLFKEHHSFFLRYAHKLCYNYDVAQDLVSGVYLNLLLSKIELKGNIRNYVLSCIRNEFIDLSSKSAYERSLRLGGLDEEKIDAIPSLLVDPFEDEERIEEERRKYERGHAILQEAINAMNPSSREAFQYRIIEGLSVIETAKVTGATEGSVKMNTSRAYTKIRETFRKHGIVWDTPPPITGHGKNTPSMLELRAKRV